MMSSITQLKGAAIGIGAPGGVLSEVNDLLNKDNETAMFVTVLYAVYNPDSGVITYANGGHNPPVIIHADGSSTMLPMTGGIALGVAPGVSMSRALHVGSRRDYHPIHRRRDGGHEW